MRGNVQTPNKIKPKSIKKKNIVVIIVAVICLVVICAIIYECVIQKSQTYTVVNGYVEKSSNVQGIVIKQEKVIEPHMDMDYSDNYSDYLIKANYRLSDYDRSVINTYFMDEGMGKYDDYKGQTFKIRSIIKEWLTNFPKRKIDESIEVDEQKLFIGKCITAEIITNIWNSYTDIQIQNHAWPKQCKDMEKYLFEMDLANIIGVKSIRKELIELYNVLSKRVAILYQQDPNLKISSSSNGYLAYANYKLLIQGYEDIINMSYGDYKKSLEIDLSTLKLKESHEIDGIYYWDEDPEVKTTITPIGTEEVKKLVKSLDNQNE